MSVVFYRKKNYTHTRVVITMIERDRLGCVQLFVSMTWKWDGRSDLLAIHVDSIVEESVDSTKLVHQFFISFWHLVSRINLYRISTYEYFELW